MHDQASLCTPSAPLKWDIVLVKKPTTSQAVLEARQQLILKWKESLDRHDQVELW